MFSIQATTTSKTCRNLKQRIERCLFCMEADYVVSNTWFQKNQEGLLTFRNTDTTAFQPPYTNARFAQIDYVLTNKPWKNSVKSVHTTAHTTIASDDKLLVAKLETKLAIKKKEKIVQAPKYRKPTEEQLRTYNLIADLFIQGDPSVKASIVCK